MNLTLKIFKTNWVNLLSVFVSVYFFIIAAEMSNQQESFKESLSIAVFGGLFGILYYGMIFWISFLLLLFLIDLILIKNTRNLEAKLFLEWFIISIPFSYWFIKYQEWILLIGCIAFLIGQYLRKPKIFELLESKSIPK